MTHASAHTPLLGAPSAMRAVSAASESRAVRSHRQLAAWQRAIELCVACHQLADRLPETQRAGLGAQLRRAAGAVPAHIAEGHGRLHRGDYVQHLSLARGALKQLEAHLVVAHRLRHLDGDEAARLDRECWTVGRLLSRLIRSLCEGR